MYHDSSGIIFRYFSPQYHLHTAFTPESCPTPSQVCSFVCVWCRHILTVYPINFPWIIPILEPRVTTQMTWKSIQRLICPDFNQTKHYRPLKHWQALWPNGVKLRNAISENYRSCPFCCVSALSYFAVLKQVFDRSRLCLLKLCLPTRLALWVAMTETGSAFNALHLGLTQIIV